MFERVFFVILIFEVRCDGVRGETRIKGQRAKILGTYNRIRAKTVLAAVTADRTDTAQLVAVSLYHPGSAFFAAASQTGFPLTFSVATIIRKKPDNASRDSLLSALFLHAADGPRAKVVEPNSDQRARHIVDEIIDSGATMKELVSRLKSLPREERPVSVSITSLLARKSFVDDPLGLCELQSNGCNGIVCPMYVDNDKWLVGYGMEDEGKCRNLKDIWVKCD